MKINQITLSDLRRMNGKEGLILQGCGGETQEWVDGINEMLTDKGILLDDTKFENISVFMSDGITCILYPFEDVHLDIGKLAMWRLQSYTAFAGMWLSDYVDNRLGGFEPEQNKTEKLKPACALIGQDGNIFNLMGIASHTLKQNGMADEAEMMCTRIRGAENYCEALNIIGEYVNITDTGLPDGTEESFGTDSERNQVGANADDRIYPTGWEESRGVFEQYLAKRSGIGIRNSVTGKEDNSADSIKMDSNNGAVLGSINSLAESLSRIIDDESEDEEERRKRIAAEQNGSDIGTLLGLTAGMIAGAISKEENIEFEDEDFKMGL